MSDTQALDIFLNSPVTQDMIHHLVNVTLQILPCESAKTITQCIPSADEDAAPVYKTRPLPSLMTFITKLVRYTNVYTGTLMVTIVYMNRLKARLPQDAQGMACTRHRIFLACLIIAAKYFNDSSPKNKHWSKYTDGLFRKEDVNLMERQLLMLLDWDVRVETDELVAVWKRFLEPIKNDLRRQSRIRKGLAKGTIAASTQTITAGGVSASSSLNSIHSLASNASSSRSSSLSSTFSADSASSAPSSSPTSPYSSGKNPQYAQLCYGDSYVPYTDHNVGCAPLPPASGFADYQVASYLSSCAAREQQQFDIMMRQYCGGY